MKFGLENIHKLLSTLDNPHKKFPSVHIAGTNGKGSTAAMISAMLTASGYKTGLYTSPHLVKFSERIRIDGKEIPEEQVVTSTRFLQREIERTKSTFFEATTAIAFQYFAESGVDIAVIEVGLGGRLDATNVVNPLLTVITSIGLDHASILGTSITHIAREKGGIMKKGVPCIVGEAEPEALNILKDIAVGRKAKFIHNTSATKLQVKGQSLGGIVFDVRTKGFQYKNYTCSLPGNFQINNIRLALTAIHMLKEMGFEKIIRSTIKKGLGRIGHYSGIRGRLEVLNTKPLVLMDVAHNPDAMRCLVGSLLLLHLQNMVVLFGAMKDKDVGGMVAELQKIARVVIAVSVNTSRALEPKEIVRLFHSKRGKCINGESVRNGVRRAEGELRENETLLVTGSHYVVGAFLQENHLKT